MGRNAVELCMAAAARAMANRRPELAQELPMDAPKPEIPARPRFDGADYQAPRDDARLTGQLQRIWELMKDGHWRTLEAIAEATGDPEPSISAQLRHLRKDRFGGHAVERRHISNGLYEYRVVK